LTPLLYHLPNATLAAVIMMAVLGLINFKAIGHAWQANRHDGVAAVVTFVATLGFAPHLDKGILAGAGLAIVLYLYRTMHPRVAILGRFEDGTLRDLKVHPDLPTDPRIIAVRFDGRLYFANVSFFEDAMLAAVAQQPEAKFLLVVGDGINELDASGEEVLHHLVRRLKDAGVTLVFSGLKRQVLEVMYRTNLYEAIGAAAIHATEEMAIDAIYEWLDVDEADGVFCPLKRQPQPDRGACQMPYEWRKRRPERPSPCKLQRNTIVLLPWSQHAVLEVVAQAAREHRLFDVLAVAHHVLDRVGVVDADHVLLDDRPLVQIGGDVVAGRADQLDALGPGLVVGTRPDEAGQEAVVDVDDAPGIGGAQFGGEDLHVAREHHHVAAHLLEQASDFGKGGSLVLGVTGTWWKGMPCHSTKPRKVSWLEITHGISMSSSGSASVQAGRRGSAPASKPGSRRAF
jgi:anti-anti-sigma regulatory factor